MALSLPTIDVLETLTIATPCDVPWNSMHGDHRSRYCGQCRKQVFDLANMTDAEARSLFTHSAERPCVRVYRRPDGRVLTSDCPVGFRTRIWRRLRNRASWAASVFAMLFLSGC